MALMLCQWLVIAFGQQELCKVFFFLRREVIELDLCFREMIGVIEGSLERKCLKVGKSVRRRTSAMR